MPPAAALTQTYDCAFLDLDGVLYLGSQPVDGAADALEQAEAEGMRLAFVTNNALRTPQQVSERLRGHGVDAPPQDIISSAQAVAAVIADRHGEGARVLVVGGCGLETALREAQLEIVESADERPDAVAQGFGGPDMPFSRFTEACHAINAGAAWYASNPDPTIPTDRGPAPGNGAAVDLLRTSTGQKPFIAGKPYPPIHRLAATRTKTARPLCVGDRLDTDIAAGHHNDCDSLLVLTGVTSPKGLVAAAPQERPTYIAADLRTGLLQAHPTTEKTHEGWSRCNGWRARPTSATDLALEGSGTAMDALRALCHAAWTAAPDACSTLGCGDALRVIDALRAEDGVRAGRFTG
ncbi:HAD-IIA family hydrolase [Streptomyces sp. NPDC050264]|uniref:HAD-IIA family hydrolase n=1 Tax=Streptomyces sp. NPDC050264 TaxID=3155038 RepID=UPI003433C8BD